MERVKRKLVLENGDVYVGTGFGASADAIGEIVFNTSMAGYQEIISDPSYTDQIIVMDKGRIVEVGNHVSLIARKGTYYNLVKNQLELGN